MAKNATTTVSTPTAPAAAAAPTGMPTITPIAPWTLASVAPEERAAFLSEIADLIDALRNTPRGLDRDERKDFVDAARRARIRLVRAFPVIESMQDIGRFTVSVAVTVRTADGEKTTDRRPIRLADAVYARLGLYGRTMESVGLA